MTGLHRLARLGRRRYDGMQADWRTPRKVSEPVVESWAFLTVGLVFAVAIYAAASWGAL